MLVPTPWPLNPKRRKHEELKISWNNSELLVVGTERWPDQAVFCVE